MKKNIYLIITLFLIFIFSGCSSTNQFIHDFVYGKDQIHYSYVKFRVRNKKITDNGYSYYTDRKYGNIRVIGVFPATKTNKVKIKKVINNVFSKLKAYDDLQNVNKRYSFEEKRSLCDARVSSGMYGYFRNIIEKRQLMEVCIDELKDNYRCWMGEKFIPNKESHEIRYITNNKCKYYEYIIKVKVKIFDNKIILYIQHFTKQHLNDKNKIYSEAFTTINNLLLKELKKENLKNISRKAIFEKKVIIRRKHKPYWQR